MTKRLVEIDDEKLSAVQRELGTETMKATVDAALEEVLMLVERRKSLLAQRGVDASELADKDLRRSAWG